MTGCRLVDDVVAESARAELAEVSEVFAELGGLDAGDFGERLTGNGLNIIVPQPRQTPRIYGQAVDRLARNFRAMRFLQAGEN